MNYNPIGKNIIRPDAVAKVTGQADFTLDIPVKNLLHGKIVRSTIAHGLVKSLDISEALKVPGVVKILTPDDLPSVKFPTAGHPHTITDEGKDVFDRNILTKKVRLYGDEIAAVIAETELAAQIAAEKVKAEYEVYPFYLTPGEALAEGAIEIHEGTKNIINETTVNFGNIQQGFAEADFIFEDKYETQTVQHCHLENQAAYAYKGPDQRWVCVSSTQIPHIVRRILGQALNMPWSSFRVIKPFVGGGFGNKQDVTIEPLVVAMSMSVGGKPVRLRLAREESIAFTRVRHAISYKIKAGVTKEGLITAVQIEAVSNNGAYASHGHSIVMKGSGMTEALYSIPNFEYTGRTVYTNTAAAGAMRGYGVPQIMFALECHVDKICKKLNFDPIEFRLKNLVAENSLNKLNNIVQLTNKLDKCLLKGKEIFDWDEKKKKHDESSVVKKGVGVAAFAYTSGVYPKGFEIAGCRLILNQDASVKIMLGAAEIGQGSDTVLAQMAAQTLGIAFEKVYVDFTVDTDYAPFDLGAYASRQTYVTGMAVKEAAAKLKEKILHSANKFHNIEADGLDIVDGNLVYKINGQIIESLEDLTLKIYYDWDKAEVLTAESSVNCHENSYPMGATFAEVEVNTISGKVNILSILNVHDSGKIINPLLAEGQVEGGMSMGIGYCLLEKMLYDGKTGAPLNNNLLDYKIPTFMDIPDLSVAFVEAEDPKGPYGNKALGEPPVCSPAPAIRNAILDAVGVEINEMPMSCQKIFKVLQG